MTKTVARDPPIVTKFCKRIEDEIRNAVATERPTDPTFKPAITFFRKIQKRRNIISRQTDKSKVFHIDTRENYIKKSAQYMDKTNAYIEIQSSPLREIIEKTDKGDVSICRFSGPKNLDLILLSSESAFIPDYFSQVYFLLFHSPVFHAWGPPQISKKIFCRGFLRCTHSSIELTVLTTNIILFLKIGSKTAKI